MGFLVDPLLWLLGIKPPENTSLDGAGLGLRGGPVHGWTGDVLFTLLFLALAAVVVYLYVLERGKLGVRRFLMAGLRVVIVAYVILLLFRPVLLVEFKGQRPQSVAMLLDASQSMTQQDHRLSVEDKRRVAIAYGLLPADTPVATSDAPSSVPRETKIDPPRIDLVKAVLSDSKRELIAHLQSRGPVRPFYFGDRLRSAVDETAAREREPLTIDKLLAAYKAEEPRTALADAVYDLLQRKDGDLPAAVVVVTDGQDNGSKMTLLEAAQECARLKVPLHIYGVGSVEAGTLQMRDVIVPDTIFYDDTISVPVRWRARGFKKGTVHVELKLGGKVVAERDVPIHLGEDLREVLSFTPDKNTFTLPKNQDGEEKLDFEASVTLKGDATYTDKLVRSVRLSDSKVKLLYIENSPRWEYKFLQSALLRDRRIDASFLLLNGDPKVLQGGRPFLPSFPEREQLLKYDLIILGDIPATYFGKEKLELIREFVRDFRGGLIMIAGRQNAPASYVGSPLAEVLPVEFLPVKFPPDAADRPQPFTPVLTTPGESTDMLALADQADENVKVWSKLPGWYWHYPVTKLRPGATPMLVHPREKMGKEPMPLLATQYYGTGQVLFMATDETWRWRWNAEDKHFVRFWGQVIYQLALPHLLGNASNRVQAALERSEAVLNRPGSIYVRLLDKEFRAVKAEKVPAELVHLDAKPGQERTRKVTLLPVTGRDGEYRLVLANDQQGRFELKLPGTEQPFQYRVQVPPRHEMEETGLAEEALREAARVSGGSFYREEDLYRLPEQVQEKKTTFFLRQEVLLWNWLTFVLFLSLITAEWLFRKFSNLS